MGNGMRGLFALVMLVVLALSGAAPACAGPMPTHHKMTHSMPKPGQCDEQPTAHDCIGCGIALPEAPDLEVGARMPVALPPVARQTSPLVGLQPRHPLQPPRFLT